MSKKRKAPRQLTKGTQIRILLYPSEPEDKSALLPPGLYRNEQGQIYRDAGTIGAGIPILAKPIEDLYDFYEPRPENIARRDHLAAREVYVSKILEALETFTDAEALRAIQQIYSQHQGARAPLPALIRQIAVKRRGKISYSDEDPFLLRRKQIALKFKDFNKGRGRNLTICRAWDGEKIPLPSGWNFKTWVGAYEDKEFRNRIDVRINSYTA